MGCSAKQKEEWRLVNKIKMISCDITLLTQVDEHPGDK
jgi:hypothetical protein